ncbi:MULTISPECIES: CopD family protein [Gordonia]|uniref:CopD family protein n=1 Tax=Gordonia TaxID=2053 RepID=UPI0025C421CE|nr:CopD family protein [Gordonia sp. UBA5067]
MAKRAEADPARWVAGLGTLVALAVGAGLALALAGAAGPPPSVWLRAVALGASVLLVGLGSIERLGVAPSARVIGVSAVVWFIAAVGIVWLGTAERAGVSPARVTVTEFAGAWSAHPGELIGVGCALAVVLWALGRLTARIDMPPTVVAGAAGVGLTAVAVGGHAGVTALGPVVVGAHTIAAAWWCGTLAALAVTVRGRAGWASALPRFSATALWAVVLLVVSGVVAAVVNVDAFGGPGLSVWWTSGYGRVVSAKALALLGLAGLAAAHRRRWVPRARAHRVDAGDSLRHAAVEVAVMAVALGLAAGLAGTAPG